MYVQAVTYTRSETKLNSEHIKMFIDMYIHQYNYANNYEACHNYSDYIHTYQ